MRGILAASFFAFAAWALKPDKLEDEGASEHARGAFLTTVVLFLVAEMGDKTQFATIALGARYASLTAVVIGTTPMIANPTRSRSWRTSRGTRDCEQTIESSSLVWVIETKPPPGHSGMGASLARRAIASRSGWIQKRSGGWFMTGRV